MMLRKATIRLAALFVLLASAGDYWAYDRADATAPMNSPAGMILTSTIRHSFLSAAFHAIDSPDDHCLWCAPSLAASSPVLPRAHASSFVFRSVPVFLPSRDPVNIEQPPEIISSESMVVPA
jgi:hypothetical protein